MADSTLFAFDVDGTLIGSRDGRVVWQLLNQHFGSDPEEDGKLWRAYIAGEITYAQWVDLDVGRWQKAHATRAQLVEVIARDLFPVPGALETLRTLKQRGARLAVISGTLDLTLEIHFPESPFDRVFTNLIWFDAAGQIAGWEATAYDMDGKALALGKLAEEAGLPLSRTVYVGDNINDIEAMGAAGFSVAFEPKDPSVSEAASVTIEGDMRRLLELPELVI